MAIPMVVISSRNPAPKSPLEVVLLMRNRFQIASAFIGLAALLGLNSLCRAIDAPSLNLQPSSLLVLPSYSEMRMAVEFKNATDTTLSSPVLSWSTNDGFQVKIGKASSNRARPGESIVWPVTISNIEHSRTPGTLVFHLKCRALNGGSRDLFASLPINSQADGTPKPIEASIEGSFDAVTQNRPGEGELYITNNLDVPVHADIDPLIPTSAFQPIGKEAVNLGPRSTTDVPMLLVAQDRLTPGTYPFAFQITASWESGSHREQRRIIVSKSATAGVFFESELLKALAIPSLLVLPGCLAVFTAQFLVATGLFGIKNQSNLPDLSVNKPGFWVVAISVSGIFALFYIKFYKVNYLVRYGPDDILHIWLWSIALGAVAFSLYALVSLWHRLRHVPSAKDNPLATLKKMSRNGLGLVTSKISFQIKDSPMEMFLIQPLQDEQTLVWVAPPIAADWADTNDGRTAAAEFGRRLNNNEDPGVLADWLKNEKKLERLTAVRWVAGQRSVPTPYHLKVENITGWPQPDRIVVVGAG
jgi:hypothetical protein